MLQRVTTLLGKFRRNDDAVAAVEFALVMPFLLALYFGSLEASALYTADKRVNTISSTVGDLIAQTDPNDSKNPYITSTTMTNYFNASTQIIAPYSPVGVKQVVSMVFVKSDGTTKVIWSVANGTGAIARTIGSVFTPLASGSTTNQVARGGCIIASETTYSYKPLLGQVFTSAVNLGHTNYFIPRYGATGAIKIWTDSSTLTGTTCTSGSPT